MSRAFKLFAFFAASTFALASLGYLLLHAVMPHGEVFGGLYRMFMYHETYPFQYIAVIAFTYAVIAAGFVIRWRHLSGWRQGVAIISIILLSVFVASVPGGVLWKIHDMQAGYFTTGSQFWSDLFWGASTGLKIGWLVIALSLPYNIIGFIVGYAVTFYGYKIAAAA